MDTDSAIKSPLENRAYQRARYLAVRRLIAAYPEVWTALFAEELRKVEDDPRYAGAFNGRQPKPRKVRKIRVD